MSKIARVVTGLASCLALAACGSSDAAPTVVKPAPTAEAKARALSAADLALGRMRKAAAEGDFVMVKALLDQGLDVNGVDPTDPQRNTALHAAVDPGHFPVAKLLFQRGADVAAKNAAGETPVDLARKKNHEAISVLLGMRPAAEAVPAATAAAPVDPAQLDPGALIAKVGDILHNAQPASEQTKADAPAKPEPTPALPPPVVVAPQPATAAPTAAPQQEEIPPELSQKKDELCAQITAAMGQLTDVEALTALEEAGISREVALQQLEVARSACKP